jgi:ketosteroid isomerase-like protein
MSELDDFLSTTLPRQIEAEEALHNGDPEPRLRMWSRNDPVTVLGALGIAQSGSDTLTNTFRWLASRYSNCTAYDFELLAAGANGDLAYTVGIERCTRSFAGGPPESTTVRATHAYRRENGEWKIAHRHGDQLGIDRELPAEDGPK